MVVVELRGQRTHCRPWKTISYRIERSSFPNQVTGMDAKRIATLSGDELKLDNPGRTAGGRTVIVLRRAK
jgi:hypothetical protein